MVRTGFILFTQFDPIVKYNKEIKLLKSLKKYTCSICGKYVAVLNFIFNIIFFATNPI